MFPITLQGQELVKAVNRLGIMDPGMSKYQGYLIPYQRMSIIDQLARI